MGSHSSKTTRGAIKGKKNEMIVKQQTQAKLQQCKKQINIVQQQVARDTNHSKEECAKMMVITEKAKYQIDRESKAFTKNDLIAILIAIGTIQPKDMEKVEEEFTVPELMMMIRGNIYDLGRIMEGKPTAIMGERVMLLENGKGKMVVKK